MNFDPKPVTLEEYNQSLRDTVNAYYTHAINDPGMSREDALKSTGEMAEKYLEAVEEYQNTQNTQICSGTENNVEGVQSTADVTATGTTAIVDNETEISGSVEAASENNSDPSVDTEGINDGEDCEDELDI